MYSADHLRRLLTESRVANTYSSSTIVSSDDSHMPMHTPIVHDYASIIVSPAYGVYLQATRTVTDHPLLPFPLSFNLHRSTRTHDVTDRKDVVLCRSVGHALIASELPDVQILSISTILTIQNRHQRIDPRFDGNLGSSGSD